MRSRILELIPQFLNLSTLIIGPGSSGGWIPIKVKLKQTTVDKISRMVNSHNLIFCSENNNISLSLIKLKFWWIPLRIEHVTENYLSSPFYYFFTDQGAAALHLSCSISELKQLQIFSLKKDCTMDILSAVVLNSGTTLRYII